MGTFIQICKQSQEKSGKRVWETDRQTDGQTDKVQTYSPLPVKPVGSPVGD